MAYNDLFRLSSHTVISDDLGQVLMLKANYGSFSWGLPGGSLDPQETVHEALIRECKEELGCDVEVQYLSGVYFHKAYNSQAFIFRCRLAPSSAIRLSSEHTEYSYMQVNDMPDVQQKRIRDCLDYDGVTLSAKF